MLTLNSPPGGAQRAPTPTEGGAPVSKPTAPVPRPTNTFPESNANCGHWYNVSHIAIMTFRERYQLLTAFT
jgi:hypothetical protein